MDKIKNKVILGNCLEVLKNYPSESIDCLITSPPYWGLRNYETSMQIWDGDTNPCNNHVFNEQNFCINCNAWKGELGQEPLLQIYILHLKQIFSEVYRILKSTGTCMINISDTYISKGSPSRHKGYNDPKYKNGRSGNYEEPQANKQTVRAKSLAQIPERFALMMTDELNFIKRNTIIWHKPSAMPESARDRFTSSYEYIYFFSKEESYYFNLLFEPLKQSSIDRAKYGIIAKSKESKINTDLEIMGERFADERIGRRMRDLWQIPNVGTEYSHFATYPKKLVERMVNSICPEYVCVKCGNPRDKIYERLPKIGTPKKLNSKYVGREEHSPHAKEKKYIEINKYIIPLSLKKEITSYIKTRAKRINQDILDVEFGKDTWSHWIRSDKSGLSLPSKEQYLKLKDILNLNSKYDKWLLETIVTFKDDRGGSMKFYGYVDKCECGNKEFDAGIVLDPFAGSGTTLKVAAELNRNYSGIELNKSYFNFIIDKRLKTIQRSLF